MGDEIRKQWDDWFQNEKSYQLDINYVPWLDRYAEIFSSLRSKRALDLGCGRGFDTRYLSEYGFETLTADYSWGALLSARKTARSSRLLQFDLRNNIPLKDACLEIVVANLSLHYFSQKDTEAIIEDIYSVLAPHGWLFARVNSTNDHGFQSVKDDESLKIEEDYFLYRGIPRRYFKKSSILDLFTENWEFINLEEKNLMRYEKPKVLWEIVVQKNPMRQLDKKS